VPSVLQNLIDQGTPITPESLSQPSTLSFLGADVAALITKAVPVQPINAPPSAPFSALYVFGDSLSDDGNVAIATAHTVPVSPPYSEGVFSNGPNWAQDLAKDINLPALQPSLAGGTDFAYGGAQTGQTPNHTLNPTDLASQVNQFSTQVSAPQASALYAIWIGSNDVLNIADNSTLTPAQQQSDVSAAVANEVAAIDTLASHGAKDFLVLNVPDLGKTPDELAHPTTAPVASALAAQYDNQLATAIQGLEASGSLKFDLVNTYSLLDQAIANPSAYGFTNVTDPAWTGNLTNSHSGTLNPNVGSYLFFDTLHPTALTHSLIADDISQTLGPVFA
jgi:phospholipase/lecithinase/hemolysin